VLDANIYIAAFLKRGLADQILERASQNELMIIVSFAILNEAKSKLIKKFHFPVREVDSFMRGIKPIAIIITPKKHLQIVKDDPADDKILEAAIEGNANIIVTMDAHLLKLKKIQNIPIMHLRTLTWLLPKS
jgi:putative PIN family toxin of toxin-antitoxin system